MPIARSMIPAENKARVFSKVPLTGTALCVAGFAVEVPKTEKF